MYNHQTEPIKEVLLVGVASGPKICPTFSKILATPLLYRQLTLASWTKAQSEQHPTIRQSFKQVPSIPLC